RRIHRRGGSRLERRAAFRPDERGRRVRRALLRRLWAAPRGHRSTAEQAGRRRRLPDLYFHRTGLLMDKARRRIIPLWARITVSAVLALLVLVLVGVGLRFWITSDGGRAFVVSQIDGRRVGPLGTTRGEGLDGDPLQAATFADIALVDDDGVWLRARDARIEWTPQRLFGGALEIQTVKVRLVEVMRAPRTTYQSEGGPGPDIGFKLDEIVVDELRIASDVLSPDAASYRVSGGAARGRDGSGFARLGVFPLAGPADRSDADITWSAGDVLQGDIKATGPADGVLATLIRAPE